jgi:hypothetical protein
MHAHIHTHRHTYIHTTASRRTAAAPAQASIPRKYIHTHTYAHTRTHTHQNTPTYTHTQTNRRSSGSSFNAKNTGESNSRKPWEVFDLSPEDLVDRARASLEEVYGPDSEVIDVTYIPHFARHLSHALHALRHSHNQQRARGCVLVGPRGSGRKGVLRAACAMCAVDIHVLDGITEGDALDMLNNAVAARMHVMFIVSLRAGLLSRPNFSSALLALCKSDSQDDTRKGSLGGLRFAIIVDTDAFALSQGDLALPKIMKSFLRFLSVDWYQGWSDEALARSIHMAGQSAYATCTSPPKENDTIRSAFQSMFNDMRSNNDDADVTKMSNGDDDDEKSDGEEEEDGTEKEKRDDTGSASQPLHNATASSSSDAHKHDVDDPKIFKPWHKQFSEAMFRTHRCIEQAALSSPSAGLNKWFNKSSADDYPPPNLAAIFARFFARVFAAKTQWVEQRKAQLLRASTVYEDLRAHGEMLNETKAVMLPKVRQCSQDQRKWRDDAAHFSRWVAHYMHT